MDVKLCHISGGRYSFLVRSSDMVQQGSLVFVLGDMPGRKVVVVKLVLGLHGVRQSMHHIVHCTHGTELERGPRDSCSKENSLIMV